VETHDFRDDKAARDVKLSYGTAVAVVTRERPSAVELADLILQVNGRSVATRGEWEDALGLLEKARPSTLKLAVKRAPAVLRGQARTAADWATVLTTAWEMREVEVTVPLTWPK
jgi:hypothetical protein